MDAIEMPAEEQPSKGTATLPDADNTHLDSSFFYQKDPPFVLLADRLHLNEFAVAGIAIVTSVLVLFGLGAFFSVFDTNYIIRSSLQTFIVFPLLAYFCMRIPQEIATLFNTFVEHKVIGEQRTDRTGPASYEDFVELLIAWVDRSWWTLIALGIVIIFWLYRLLVIEPTLTSPVEHAQFWLRIAILALYSIMIYSVALAALRLVVTLIFTNILFRSFKIVVNPLHPDGSAGLGVMARMLGISVGFITTMGAAAIVMNAAFLSPTFSITVSSISVASWEAIGVSILYLALAPTLLVGWLLAPHDAMQEALNEALQPLADQFQSTITADQPSSNASADEIKKGTDRLSELKRRYDLLQDTFPVWPAQINQIRRLVATISLPAVITFLLSLPQTYKAIYEFVASVFQIGGH